MYNERLENLIDAALADGELTEKEKQILFKNAQVLGVDLDEFEMVLDAKLFEKKKKMQQELAATQPQVSSAPKSNKFGDVRKCPQCGAVVQAMQAICPECGHEFTGIGANSSTEKLSVMLQKVVDDCESKFYSISLTDRMSGITTDQKKEVDICSTKADVISTFPVPNTKEDLIEFAVTMQTGVKTNKKYRFPSDDVEESKNKLHNAYSAKYDECISKMKIMFPNDPMFKSLLEQQGKVEEKKGFFGKLFGK